MSLSQSPSTLGAGGVEEEKWPRIPRNHLRGFKVAFLLSQLLALIWDTWVLVFTASNWLV